MCAIAGVLDLKTDPQILDSMLSTMQRRGPDASGIYQSQHCALLHSRLAIIDPAGGSQPMTLAWDIDTYTIVYNGELYNTKELRDELRVLGHHFEGHSDTEVVLHAYAQWGEDSLLKFNGIFAFAVWEEKERRLFLARDRIGVKPLFYKQHQGGFLFASELKTILKYPSVTAELDAQGAAQILLIGPGRVPGSGVFKDIFEIEPGCCGYYQNKRFHWERYWRLIDREHGDSFAQTTEYVRYLVTDAINRQMVSDVPIGTFLSGGLDSSLITSICASQMNSRGEVLNTFSVDYEDNDRYFVPGKFQPNTDGGFIRIMKDALNTEHHWTVLTPEELVASIEEATIARDLPGMADVDFSLLLFCKDIRKHVKVALSGECADEIFGGYPWYRDPEIRAREGFPWAQNSVDRSSFLSNDLAGQIDALTYINDQYRTTLNASDILPSTDPTNRRMKEMVNLNHRWFMQTLLDRKDRMSMYSGLEVRVPFCDYRIAEYLYSVPWEFKDHNGYEKGLLRQAMTGILPDEVLWRKKSPYPKTHDPKYKQIVSQMLRKVLDDPNQPIHHLVKTSALEALLKAEYIWPWYGQLMKEPQTIAYMLQINFWLKAYNIRMTF